MSLFQMREWWTMKLGSGEDFTSGSMVVANIDNAPSGEAKIITGSLQGRLRVHQPDRYPDPERRSDDLLVEQALDAPVLQARAFNLSDVRLIADADNHFQQAQELTQTQVGALSAQVPRPASSFLHHHHHHHDSSPSLTSLPPP